MIRFLVARVCRAFGVLIFCFSAVVSAQEPYGAQPGFIRQPVSARISGQPMTLDVGFITLCFDGITGQQTSVMSLVNTPGVVTIKIVGYCPPFFLSIFKGRSFDVSYLTPGVYDVRYAFYNFDGSFVTEGRVPSEPEFPFTVLAPTQENLDRIFRVPTISATGLIWLSALIVVVVVLRARYRKI